MDHSELTIPIVVACMTMAITCSTALAGGSYTLVAFGDSTTARRAAVEVYAQLLQEELPRRGIDVKVVNAGVPGNTTVDARKRWEDDVLDAKPDLVIIQFGINDSTVEVFKNPPATSPPVAMQEYRENLEFMVKSLKERKFHVILMTPNPLRWTPKLKELYGKRPYRPESPESLNLFLKRYVKVVRQVARAENVDLVDIYAAFENYGREPGKSVDDLLLDGMHPNNQGQRLVAGLLLPQIVGLLRCNGFRPLRRRGVSCIQEGLTCFCQMLTYERAINPWRS